jgi:hypothetical protein
MKSRHLKLVPHFLDDDLRAKQLEDVRQLLDVLQAEEKCHSRDLITGDETWVFLDIKPVTIWLPIDAELPVHAKKTIVRESRMLVIFWGIHGIVHYMLLALKRYHVRFTILL